MHKKYIRTVSQMYKYFTNYKTTPKNQWKGLDKHLQDSVYHGLSWLK